MEKIFPMNAPISDISFVVTSN